jgi:hypothetical protein
MDIWIKILLAILFYAVVGFFYRYSKGKFKVAEEKREEYNRWLEKYGKKASRACLNLAIAFTFLYILYLFQT